MAVPKDHPLHSTRRKDRWLQRATSEMKSKGSEGSLTRIAKEHGESPMEFAREHYHDKKHPSWAAKSRFAVNANR